MIAERCSERRTSLASPTSDQRPAANLQGAFLLFDVAAPHVERDAVLIPVEDEDGVGAGGKPVGSAQGF